ncbi:MAG: hypothetical protein ABIA76_05565 [Candidatus Diapherotrites archaeon]
MGKILKITGLIVILIFLFSALFVLGFVKDFLISVECETGDCTTGTPNGNETGNGLGDLLGGIAGVVSGGGTTVLEAQTIGKYNVTILNTDIAWIDSDTIAFESAGQVWAYDFGGTPKILTETTNEFRGWGPMYAGGSNPIMDPLTGRITYIGYKDGGGWYNANKIPYRYYLESVSLSGTDYKHFTSIEIPGESNYEMSDYRISPNGTMLLISNGYLINDFEKGTNYDAEKLENLGFFGEFTYDSSGIIYKNNNGFYLYEIGTKESEKILETKCYRWSYCAKENLLGCVKESEGFSKPIYVYDLNSGNGRQIGTDNATSQISWSPNCDKFVYRTYDHSKVELKMMKVN